jgi:hypothetical protein
VRTATDARTSPEQRACHQWPAASLAGIPALSHVLRHSASSSAALLPPTRRPPVACHFPGLSFRRCRMYRAIARRVQRQSPPLRAELSGLPLPLQHCRPRMSRASGWMAKFVVDNAIFNGVHADARWVVVVPLPPSSSGRGRGHDGVTPPVAGDYKMVAVRAEPERRRESGLAGERRTTPRRGQCPTASATSTVVRSHLDAAVCFEVPHHAAEPTRITALPHPRCREASRTRHAAAHLRRH